MGSGSIPGAAKWLKTGCSFCFADRSGSIREVKKKKFSLFFMLYLDLKEILNFNPAKCDF
jgi:hypothetical protein